MLVEFSVAHPFRRLFSRGTTTTPIRSTSACGGGNRAAALVRRPAS
jgi:hypothetical protein